MAKPRVLASLATPASGPIEVTKDPKVARRFRIECWFPIAMPTSPNRFCRTVEGLPSHRARERLPAQLSGRAEVHNSAIRHADGRVSGEFELKSEQDGGVRLHGNVICFTIVGNTARLGGFIAQSSEPAFEGLYAVWTIVDTGEGRNDPPDLTSDFFLFFNPAAAQAHCNAGLNVGPLLPVLGGNLQVHP